jgi:hypothetical protein
LGFPPEMPQRQVAIGRANTRITDATKEGSSAILVFDAGGVEQRPIERSWLLYLIAESSYQRILRSDLSSDF